MWTAHGKSWARQEDNLQKRLVQPRPGEMLSPGERGTGGAILWQKQPLCHASLLLRRCPVSLIFECMYMLVYQHILIGLKGNKHLQILSDQRQKGHLNPSFVVRNIVSGSPGGTTTLWSHTPWFWMYRLQVATLTSPQSCCPVSPGCCEEQAVKPTAAHLR